MTSELQSILDKSRAEEVGDRIAAVRTLRHYLESPTVFQRLAQMLDDDNIAVLVDAAEILVRYADNQGLIAVLNELGRRNGDSDLDYIVYKLQELQGSGEVPLLQRSRALSLDTLPPEVAVGAGTVEENFGHYELHT